MRINRSHRASKYGNKKIERDGKKFDSLKESSRYRQLELMEKAGDISDLKLHPSYKLILPDGTPVLIKGDKKKTIARYVPDFEYWTFDENFPNKERGHTKRVIEDVKSRPTAKDKYFKLKRAIFEACTGLEVKVHI